MLKKGNISLIYKLSRKYMHVILGIGTDLVDIKRIEESIENHGDKFLNRVFDKTEQEYAGKKKNPAMTYAKQFAAKEAVSKAFGTGIGASFKFTDIIVAHEESGKPIITLSDQGKTSAKKIFPEAQVKIEISLSDEYPLAQAFAIIHNK